MVDPVKAQDLSEELEEEFEEAVEEPSTVGLSDDTIREIETAIDSDVKDEHVPLVNDLSVPDTPELLQKISKEDRQVLIDNKKTIIEPEVFSYLDDDVKRSTLSQMSAKQVADILSELDSDDALDLIENLDVEFRPKPVLPLKKV